MDIEKTQQWTLTKGFDFCIPTFVVQKKAGKATFSVFRVF